MSTRGADTEVALLVECMLSVPGERPKVRTLAASTVDWERLLSVARDHAVAETVHHALVTHGAADLAPAAVRSALREAHEESTARNSLLLAEAARIQRALLDATIASALLKGAALVAAHYPAVGARHVADLDLMVRGEHVEDASRILGELGARHLASLAPEAPRPATEKHAPALVLPSGVVVELHRRYGDDAATEAATAGILERARPLEWNGRTLHAASPSDLLGMTCHHVFVGHRADRRFRPRHLADCAVLLAAGAVASDSAALPGAAEVVQRSLQAVGRGVHRGLLVTATSRAGVRLEGLRQAVSHGSPSAALQHLFFPDLDFMAWRYGVDRKARLLPLLYVWRPLRGAWRLVTGR